MDIVLIDRVLNDLPASASLSKSLFTVSYAGGIATYDVQRFYATGNLLGDAWPEIIITGWGGWNADHTAGLERPLVLLSIRPDGAHLLDAQAVLGTAVIMGTSNPRIADINNDGLGDFFFIGYNEAPWGPVPAEVFVQQPDGSFARAPLGGPIGNSHNWDTGDFDGDGFLDIVSAPGTFLENRIYQGFPDMGPWIGPALYLNQHDGTFRVVSPITVNTPEGTKQAGSGSAANMGDFDHDGLMDLVVADTGQNLPDAGTHNYNWVLSHIAFLEDGSAVADLTLLPLPYFDRDTTFQNLVPERRDASHDINIKVLDVNNDGWDDILVSSIVWGGSPAYTHGGVLQILLNQEGHGFLDVTDTNLFNFYLGAGMGHQLAFMDINRDGFPDILVSEGWSWFGGNGDGSSTLHEMAANRILLNTGTGRFVDAFREEFHALSLTEGHAFAGAQTFVWMADNIAAYYMTPNGLFGYVEQAWVTNKATGDTVLGFFDFRTSEPLGTGPGGSNPALQGAPGFSENFYLTEYPQVAAAVAAGSYSSGLDHYLQLGRANGLQGFAPNAILRGAGSNDTIIGREGNEQLVGGAGNDTLEGGAGTDTAVYTGQFADYTVTWNSDGTLFTVSSAAEGIDTLHGIERLQFADRMVFTAGFLDTVAPVVSGASPAPGAVGVAVGDNISVTFNEAIARGVGDIVLKTGSGVVIETWHASSSRGLVISGSTLTIDPAFALSYGTGYQVTIAPGALQDSAGNAFAGGGVSAFSTMAAPDLVAPAVISMSPARDASNVTVGTNVVVTFSESVQRGTGVIVLKTASGSVVESFDAASSPRLFFVGSVLTIDPSAVLQFSTNYRVEIVANSVRDLAGNGISAIPSYAFSTQAPSDISPPVATSFSPSGDATGVALATSIVIAFDEAIQRGPGAIELRDGQGHIVSMAVAVNGSAMTLTPGAALASGTTYVLALGLGAVMDSAGNQLAPSSAYHFTTKVAGITTTGTAGPDTLSGGAGDDTIDGGPGLDTLVYAHALGDFTITHRPGGFSVAGPEGIDQLSNVERLIFSDLRVALDVDGNAGQAYRLYQAAFDRIPDIGGLGFQMHVLDIGFALVDIAQNFIESPEFQSRYGNLSNPEFVTRLYANVLDRDPDVAGLTFHVGNLNAGLPRNYLLAQFSESPENQANVIGAITDGMVYLSV